MAVTPASAAPKSKAVIAAAKTAVQKRSQFKRSFQRLSDTEKAKVKLAIKRNAARFGEDDDDDGLPDIYEDADGSNSCNSDSDQDGTPDGEDSDEGEGEYKGTVTSYTAPTLVVNGVTLSVTSATSFEDMNEEDLTAGACIEVKGRIISGTLTATEIKAEDDCN
jgi:hypothetical protein